MPNTVLTQLKALRDGVAQELRMDPRYRTLQALDKSIAEITSVLTSANLLPTPGPANALSNRMNGLAPAADPHAEPTLALEELPSPAHPGTAPTPFMSEPGHEAPAAAHPEAPGKPPGFKGGTAGSPPAVPTKPAASLLKPAVGIAAALAVGGVVAEILHHHETKEEPAPHKAAAKAAKAPSEDEAEAAVDADEAEDEADTDEAQDAPAGHAHAETPLAETPHAEADAEADEADAETDAEAEADEPEAHAAADHDAHGGHAATHEAAEEDAEDTEAEAEADAEHGHAPHAAMSAHAPSAEAHAADDETQDADVEDKGLHAAGDHEDQVAKEEDAEDAEDDAKPAHGETHGAATHGKAEAEAAEDEAAVIPKGKASGYVPMAAKPNAPQYAPSIAVKFGKLPNKVDLRPLMTPIENQGDTNSCVANAVAGAYEYWIKKASKKDQNISRLFVYYNARWRDGSQDKDEGSVIQLAMEGLQKFGACSESVWPFDPRILLKKPGATAYQDGAPYRVHDMAQVPLKLEAWKQALAEGKPIVFGIELFDSFDDCTNKGGVVPMPAPDDLARKKHSGHSMCAVGYNESEKVFIVRNSWGDGWGDKGYCYMPYDYMMSSKFNDGDCWVFVPKVPSQPPRETWQDSTTPVTNGGQGVDFVIQPYRIEDYERIAVDLFEHVRRPFNTIIVAEYSEYVSAVSKSMFTELETFDVKTFLETTAILAGVGATVAFASEAFSSESSTSESLDVMSSDESETESDEESDAETEDDAEDDEADADEDAEDGADDAEDAEDDAEDADDDAADDDATDDDDADSDDDAEDDAEGADADDAEGDEAEGDDAEGDDAGDDDEAEGDDAEGDDAESDDADEGDDDDGGDDGGDDDAGGDDGGGDDGGGDDD